MHSIAEQIKNEDFDNYKFKFLNIIKNICLNLPCRISSQSSIFFLNNLNINTLQKLDDIKMMLYLFHNYINKNNKKQIFNFSDTKKYKDVNISKAFGLFYNLYSNNLYLRKSVNYNNMLLVINEINKFIEENIFYYDKIQIENKINCIEEDVIEKDVIEDTIEKDVIEKDVIEKDVIEKDIIEDTIEKDVIEKDIIEKDIIEDTIEKDIIEDTIEKDVIEDTIEKDAIEDTIEKDVIEKEDVIEIKNKINNSKISIIDDLNLPSFDLTLPEAMLEMMKDKKCIPFKVYVERWSYLKKIIDKKKKLLLKELPTINDNLLPSLDLTLPIAMTKIKENIKCVPFDLYLKRWNELKIIYKHKKRFS